MRYCLRPTLTDDVSNAYVTEVLDWALPAFFLDREEKLTVDEVLRELHYYINYKMRNFLLQIFSHRKSINYQKIYLPPAIYLMVVLVFC